MDGTILDLHNVHLLAWDQRDASLECDIEMLTRAEMKVAHLFPLVTCLRTVPGVSDDDIACGLTYFDRKAGVEGNDLDFLGALERFSEALCDHHLRLEGVFFISVLMRCMSYGCLERAPVGKGFPLTRPGVVPAVGSSFLQRRWHDKFEFMRFSFLQLVNAASGHEQ